MPCSVLPLPFTWQIPHPSISASTSLPQEALISHANYSIDHYNTNTANINNVIHHVPCADLGGGYGFPHFILLTTRPPAFPMHLVHLWVGGRLGGLGTCPFKEDTNLPRLGCENTVIDSLSIKCPNKNKQCPRLLPGRIFTWSPPQPARDSTPAGEKVGITGESSSGGGRLGGLHPNVSPINLPCFLRLAHNLPT